MLKQNSQFSSKQITDFKAEPELLIDCDELCYSNDKLDDSDVIRKPKSKHDRMTCSVCDKHFNHFSNLVRHLRIHQNVKPYVCDYEKCRKTFRDSTALLVHKRGHTGVLLSNPTLENGF